MDGPSSTKSAEQWHSCCSAEPGGTCEHTDTRNSGNGRRLGTRSVVVDDPTTVTRYPPLAAGPRSRDAHLRQHARVRERRRRLTDSHRRRTMKLICVDLEASLPAVPACELGQQWVLV